MRRTGTHARAVHWWTDRQWGSSPCDTSHARLVTGEPLGPGGTSVVRGATSMPSRCAIPAPNARRRATCRTSASFVVNSTGGAETRHGCGVPRWVFAFAFPKPDNGIALPKGSSAARSGSSPPVPVRQTAPVVPPDGGRRHAPLSARSPLGRRPGSVRPHPRRPGSRPPHVGAGARVCSAGSGIVGAMECIERGRWLVAEAA